jgi:hypothetical protein
VLPAPPALQALPRFPPSADSTPDASAGMLHGGGAQQVTSHLEPQTANRAMSAAFYRHHSPSAGRAEAIINTTLLLSRQLRHSATTAWRPTWPICCLRREHTPLRVLLVASASPPWGGFGWEDAEPARAGLSCLSRRDRVASQGGQRLASLNLQAVLVPRSSVAEVATQSVSSAGILTSVAARACKGC